PKHAHYPDSFNEEGHDLIAIGKLDSYRGFIFGSLSPFVPPLDEFLGDVRPLIDLIADQGPNGVELVPGRTIYTYQGNWKLQLDNGVDPYHLSEAHSSFLDV